MKHNKAYEDISIYVLYAWFRLFSSQNISRINTPILSTPAILHTYPPMKMEQTECSETSAYKLQTSKNCPEESIQHSEHGESLKSGMYILYYNLYVIF
jgi:hypothetical protein